MSKITKQQLEEVPYINEVIDHGSEEFTLFITVESLQGEEEKDKRDLIWVIDRRTEFIGYYGLGRLQEIVKYMAEYPFTAENVKDRKFIENVLEKYTQRYYK